MIPSQKRSSLAIFQIGFLSCLNIDCIALINSEFRNQFEFLTIGAKCRRTIVYLINTFTNLQLLIVHWPELAFKAQKEREYMGCSSHVLFVFSMLHQIDDNNNQSKKRILIKHAHDA